MHAHPNQLPDLVIDPRYAHILRAALDQDILAVWLLHNLVAELYPPKDPGKRMVSSIFCKAESNSCPCTSVAKKQWYQEEDLHAEPDQEGTASKL